MATIYISDSATNGYVLGNDANPGTTKGTAVRTFTQALVLAGNNDEIVLNDSYTPYIPPALGYWSINETGLIIRSETDYGATLAGDGVYAVRLFNINSGSAVSATFGRINIDGVNITQVGVYCNQTTNLATLVFNQTKLKNFIHKPIANIHAAGAMHLTLNDVIMEGSNWQRGGVHMPNITSGGLFVNGLTVTQSGRTNSEGGIVFIAANAAGVKASVKRVTASSTLGASAGAFTHNGILIQNILGAVVEDCPEIVISGVGAGSAAATLIEISANATGVQNSSYGIISRCGGTNATSGGKTILIGSDAQNVTTQNMHNYGLITECNVKGTAISNSVHGPMLGYGTGGRIEGCTTDYCGIGGGGLLKAMIAGSGPFAVPMSVGNKVTHCFSSFAYHKGSVGAAHANCTLITAPGYTPTFEITAFDDTAAPPIQGANSIFANNVCTGPLPPVFCALQGTPGNAIDTTSGALFYRPHYDTSMGALANLWRNGSATVYANLAAFNTALAAVGHDGVNAALNLDADYNFPAGSAYLGIGYKCWGDTPNPIGSDGEPFSSFDIDLGSVQSTYSAFHPLNL